MKPAQFDYFAPATLGDAVQLLAEYGEDAKILAGGQSLVPVMNFRLAKPANLIDVNGIESLDYVKEDDGWLAVGALTRERAIERSRLIARHCPILTEATRWIGHPTIRNRGTVGGCIAHNDPAAEYPVAAALLGAQVVANGPDGSRTLAIDQFLITYLTTALQPNEIVTEVRFPKMPAGAGWSFQEFARRHGDFAVVATAALVTMDGKRVKDARIAVGGAGPVAFRAIDAEDVLKGETLTDQLVERAAERASAMAEPESDVQASAEYRAHLAKVFTRRALKEAWSRAS